MSLVDDMEREPADDEIVAAEYVLGVQPLDERLASGRRIETDRGFAGLVEKWEGNFSALSAAYEDVAPPDRVKAAIEEALFSNRVPDRRASVGFWHSLAFWRGLAFASVAAAAIAVAVPLVNQPDQAAPRRLVASLAAENSPVQYVAVYDAANARVGLSRVSGDRTAGRDLELWAIAGDNAPVSLGIVPAGDAVEVNLDADLAQRLDRGVVLAISDEPSGGSPTGQPTGPVVAAGGLQNI